MSTQRKRLVAVKDDEVVTPLELFFDLVFVYALTQVTGMLAAHLSALGLLHGAIVLTLVCGVGLATRGSAM